ncbi:hypothetical protein Strop_1366 [Salinispora tropica CNB-440]|uniref:DUF4439 domain-containing protein n=1 Tax=Salinispora tropica (strain ATCC BAA-916 / DSM 44818 / JCM 13857 / NBRC 105044 / CNB-440) TaxID=369723 RepID=A4X4N3_SALTO|nr:hypothetical protein Strop_1366 [Salinispora tropica CNB-440]
MVLTWTVMGKMTQRNMLPHGTMGYSRRKALRVGALLTLGSTVPSLTGCDPFDRDPPPPDPLAPMVDEAFALAAAYQDAVTTHPVLAGRLTPITEAHAAHAAELARVTEVALPSTTPTTSTAADSDTTLTALRERERAAGESAVQACLAAPAERAALLASIAAARASHLEALQ